MMCDVARPSRSGGAQVGEGLALQDRSNRWGGESMCFHGPNVVRCEIVWNVPDVEVG